MSALPSDYKRFPLVLAHLVATNPRDYHASVVTTAQQYIDGIPNRHRHQWLLLIRGMPYSQLAWELTYDTLLAHGNRPLTNTMRRYNPLAATHTLTNQSLPTESIR